MGDAAFVIPRDDGAHVRVRLTPRADRDAIGSVQSLADGRAVLTARVRSVPEKGRANAALEKLLATSLDVPSGRVRVVSGHKDRIKTVHISGDPAALAARVAALAGGA